MSLQGKVAIVTGGARGIGAATAIALAKEGANVVINYVSPSSKVRAENVAKAVQSAGSQALVVQADLASIEALDTLVKETVEKFGKIDILVSTDSLFLDVASDTLPKVNNGGTGEFQGIGSITVENYQKTVSHGK